MESLQALGPSGATSPLARLPLEWWAQPGRPPLRPGEQSIWAVVLYGNLMRLAGLSPLERERHCCKAEQFSTCARSCRRRRRQLPADLCGPSWLRLIWGAALRCRLGIQSAAYGTRARAETATRRAPNPLAATKWLLIKSNQGPNVSPRLASSSAPLGGRKAGYVNCRVGKHKTNCARN